MDGRVVTGSAVAVAVAVAVATAITMALGVVFGRRNNATQLLVFSPVHRQFLTERSELKFGHRLLIDKLIYCSISRDIKPCHDDNRKGRPSHHRNASRARYR